MNKALETVLLGIVLSGCGTVVAAQHAPADKVALNIAAQPVGDALNELARQTGLQVVLYSEVGAGLRASQVKGELTAEEALQRLLANSNLSYKFLDSKTVSISAPRAEGAERGKPLANTSAANGGALYLAQTGGGNAPERAPPQPAATEGKESGVLAEIVVTAQKRIESIQDVPVPVTALNADSLVANNQLLLRDYAVTVPNLNMTPSVQGNQTLAIRGITTATGNPTVAVTIDDMPYGSSTSLGGGRTIPDIDPGDLARIEVLRGPQGTLYGATSLGGLLKFVTRDPSTAGFSGRLQAGVSGIKNGDEAGYNLRGSVNVPVNDTVAIRASGFTRRDPAYIDDPVRGAEAVNTVDVNGGRVAALWRPSEQFSLKLAALAQKIEGDGSSNVDVGLGDLEQARIPQSGWYDRKTQAYNATIEAKLGRLELTSISGYAVNDYADSLDFGFSPAIVAQAQSLYGVSGAVLLSGLDSTKFSQEVRLATSTGERFHWLLGGFYTDEDADFTDNRQAADPATGALAGRLQIIHFLTTYEEYAAFADLTVDVTDRFDVQFGGRESEIRQTYAQTTLNAAGVTTLVPELRTKDSAFTYLVTPRFKISQDLMLYARFASGFRPGGPNPNPGGVVPAAYDPDKTKNYEVGFKGEFLENKLTLDASIFSIDWDDIQVSLLSPASVVYTSNGGSARSRGVELSAELRPSDTLKIAGWYVYNDAKLTENFPATSTALGRTDDRLPNSSRSSASVSLDQNIPLSGDLTGFAGVTASYVGDRIGPFRGGTPVRQTLDAYTRVDLRAGVRKDTWTATAFVTNVGDKRGELYGGLGAIPATAFTIIQPRTFGVSFSKDL